MLTIQKQQYTNAQNGKFNNLSVAPLSNSNHKTMKHNNAGFSLIELLTVIAIIAILAAIIFPVFSSAREKARQGTTMSNLQKIDEALARYAQDHSGQYPEVLFAYAKSGLSMDQMKTLKSTDGADNYLKGLYPQYINDASIFMDPNNPVDDKTSTQTVVANTLDSAGALTSGNKIYFTADAFDICPQITSYKSISDKIYVTRYQRAWTSLINPGAQTDSAGAVNNYSISGYVTQADYNRQLSMPQATGETYVTCTTYHISQQQKVIVLFKNGPAKVMDVNKFLGVQGGADAADISVSNGQSQAEFWTITP